MNNRWTLLFALGIALTGCTHWGTTQSFGPRQEVGRTLFGAPQVEEVTTTSVAAGFAGGYGGGIAAGGLAAGGSSVKRTHCVQQAQIEYEQPVTVAPRREGRGRDLVGSIATGLGGLLIMSAASSRYSAAQNDYAFDLQLHQDDPSVYPEPTAPSPPTTAYAIGGAVAVAGLAWLVYAMVALPHGPAPETKVYPRRWTEPGYVEVEGCR